MKNKNASRFFLIKSIYFEFTDWERGKGEYPIPYDISNALCTRKPALGMPLGKKIHNRHPKPLQVWLYFPAGWQNAFATCKIANTTPKFYCLSGEDEECLVFFKDIFLECLGCVIMSIPIFFILYKKKGTFGLLLLSNPSVYSKINYKRKARR